MSKCWASNASQSLQWYMGSLATSRGCRGALGSCSAKLPNLRESQGPSSQLWRTSAGACTLHMTYMSYWFLYVNLRVCAITYIYIYTFIYDMHVCCVLHLGIYTFTRHSLKCKSTCTYHRRMSVCARAHDMFTRECLVLAWKPGTCDWVLGTTRFRTATVDILPHIFWSCTARTPCLGKSQHVESSTIRSSEVSVVIGTF